MIITDRYAEVTIRRPNGVVETIRHPKVDFFTDTLLAQMRKAMTAAGRGEVLSYRNFPEVVEKEESDYITQCNRCGKTLDTRTAKNQMEWFRAGALKARVPTYYCNDCYNLLSQIGAGEYTELDERAGRKPSYEPEYKGDE